MLRSLRALPFLLPSLLAAQLPVTLTGRVEAVTGQPCSTEATHQVACSGILLVGDGVDLSTFEGRLADLSGSNIGTAACPVVAVSQAESAPQSTGTFSLGNYRRNSTVVFTTTAPIGALVAYFFSCEPGFLPLLDFGTLQLNPLTDFIYWGFDVSVGVALRTARIPDVPDLAGQRALFQTAFVAIAPALQVKLLNPGCFVIQ